MPAHGVNERPCQASYLFPQRINACMRRFCSQPSKTPPIDYSNVERNWNLVAPSFCSGPRARIACHRFRRLDPTALFLATLPEAPPLSTTLAIAADAGATPLEMEASARRIERRCSVPLAPGRFLARADRRDFLKGCHSLSCTFHPGLALLPMQGPPPHRPWRPLPLHAFKHRE